VLSSCSAIWATSIKCLGCGRRPGWVEGRNLWPIALSGVPLASPQNALKAFKRAVSALFCAVPLYAFTTGREIVRTVRRNATRSPDPFESRVCPQMSRICADEISLQFPRLTICGHLRNLRKTIYRRSQSSQSQTSTNARREKRKRDAWLKCWPTSSGTQSSEKWSYSTGCYGM
jgi:hypothetical protein